MLNNLKKIASNYFVFTKNATYKDDGIITFHNADFFKYLLFQESYRLGKETGSWGGYDLEWRVYIACWADLKGSHLSGDLVECGVNRGGLSRAVINYIKFERFNDKKFYLLDTYSGFPQEKRTVAARANLYDYDDDYYSEVCNTFKNFSNVVIVKGEIPYTLQEVKSESICYLSIDMNCYQPEIAAAEYFWDKLVSGAVIILDDYGYSDDYILQKNAFDEFAQRKGVQVLSLPTGQGLIFKP
ncbi:class I SAM-dependent methyltransferase [Calothrix sp. FACHB-1219]|uniref:TylF/MycF/NovP-related O-methyltransferase n=1 Tax=unclassified Calothrix TaxID=2619626 RepID=UPI001684E99B|nr:MULTISPECIES: TylF/MycF/NovP-related O-methyltransferase [unclassified Calothrix]MBD2201299.1 class I SAM-dependent methyltransferase [Calothrix sp. FACHB-168]MBD2215733.1 class I SAM-dependent methyltransferase [Calothrix sp. FACHB-1219]